MLLNDIRRNAKVAWCPSGDPGRWLASGTRAGSFNSNFESSATLEIYDVNAPNDGPLRPIGALQTNDTFASLAWGSKGMNKCPLKVQPNKTTEWDGSLPAGIIAGGLANGQIYLWDAAKVANNQMGSELTVLHDRHKGAVTGLQFNPQKANSLASISSEQCCVWDVANTDSCYVLFPDGLEAPPTVGGTCLAWNNQVAKILATSNSSGVTTMYDLKARKAILTFRSGSPYPVSTRSLTWHPDKTVSLAVCYEGSPVVEIWDVRKSKVPKIKLQTGQQGSVYGTAWCPHDPELLMVTSEDGTVQCWNPNTGEFLEQYQTGLSDDIEWDPIRPGTYSISTADQQIKIMGVHHTGAHVPNWLGRPVGASWGFGGQLVTHGLSQDAAQKDTVRMDQISTDPELISMSQHFRKVIDTGRFLEYCQKQAQDLKDANEKDTWSVLKILFSQNQKPQLLGLLGYTPQDLQLDAGQPEQVQSTPEPAQSNPLTAPDADDDDDGDDGNFFDQDFSDVPADSASKESKETKESKDEAEGKEPEAEAEATAEDDLIRQALVVGNFEAAVKRSIDAGNMADALAFSSFSKELWQKTLKIYFQQHKLKFIRSTVNGLLEGNHQDLVDKSDLSNWRETLAMIIAYTTGDEERSYTNKLAARLEANKDLHSASICYLVALNVDKVVEIWVRSGGKPSVRSMHKAVEKVVLFTQATKSSAQSSSVASLFGNYANELASQGDVEGAMTYLRLSGNGQVAQELMSRLSAQQVQPQQQQGPHGQNQNRGAQGAPQGPAQGAPRPGAPGGRTAAPMPGSRGGPAPRNPGAMRPTNAGRGPAPGSFNPNRPGGAPSGPMGRPSRGPTNAEIAASLAGSSSGPSRPGSGGFPGPSGPASRPVPGGFPGSSGRPGPGGRAGPSGPTPRPGPGGFPSVGSSGPARPGPGSRPGPSGPTALRGPGGFPGPSGPASRPGPGGPGPVSRPGAGGFPSAGPGARPGPIGPTARPAPGGFPAAGPSGPTSRPHPSGFASQGPGARPPSGPSSGGFPSAGPSGSVSRPGPGGFPGASRPGPGGFPSGPGSKGPTSRPVPGGFPSGPSSNGPTSRPAPGGFPSGPSSNGPTSRPGPGGFPSGPGSNGPTSRPGPGGFPSGPGSNGPTSRPGPGGFSSGPASRPAPGGFPSANGPISKGPTPGGFPGPSGPTSRGPGGFPSGPSSNGPASRSGPGSFPSAGPSGPASRTGPGGFPSSGPSGPLSRPGSGGFPSGPSGPSSRPGPSGPTSRTGPGGFTGASGAASRGPGGFPSAGPSGPSRPGLSGPSSRLPSGPSGPSTPMGPRPGGYPGSAGPVSRSGPGGNPGSPSLPSRSGGFPGAGLSVTPGPGSSRAGPSRGASSFNTGPNPAFSRTPMQGGFQQNNVAQSLLGLLNQVRSRGGTSGNSFHEGQVRDCEQRLRSLDSALRNGQVSPPCQQLLTSIVGAFQSSDFQRVNIMTTQLSRDHLQGNNAWVPGVAALQHLWFSY